MEAEDIRAEAHAVYVEAEQEIVSVPGAVRLALEIFRERLVWVPGLESPGRLVRLPDNDDGRPPYALHLRKGLRLRTAQWAAAHELGHYRIERSGWTAVVLPWLEIAASQVGAEITAPERIVRWYLRELRWTPECVSLHKMAELFRTTQTVAALRLGEVYGNPVAVVNVASLFVRDAPVILRGEWGRRPSLPWLQHAATLKRPPAGWRRVRLGDETHRVMLLRMS